ncbi:hypothetical protein SDC9_166166 [bioreactor metagenome]|uniref:Uncharacterized protein n=1 Tax=bioreactor metagenome TaxID=1076179 RepID=A0A645FW85_9ZZZZ
MMFAIVLGQGKEPRFVILQKGNLCRDVIRIETTFSLDCDYGIDLRNLFIERVKVLCEFVIHRIRNFRELHTRSKKQQTNQ